jgi:hypothetical protein
MTETRKLAAWRVKKAYAATQKLTGDKRLWFKIARLLLTLSDRELERLRK